MVEGVRGRVDRVSDVAADVVCEVVGVSTRKAIGGERDRGGIPSSRTSTIAILEGGVEASRFEEVEERRMRESSVEERRGSVATVWVAILRINGSRSV